MNWVQPSNLLSDQVHSEIFECPRISISPVYETQFIYVTPYSLIGVIVTLEALNRKCLSNGATTYFNPHSTLE